MSKKTGLTTFLSDGKFVFFQLIVDKYQISLPVHFSSVQFEQQRDKQYKSKKITDKKMKLKLLAAALLVLAAVAGKLISWINYQATFQLGAGLGGQLFKHSVWLH